MKAQRTVCVGPLIGGERPKACIHCSIESIAVDTTNEIEQQMPQTSILPIGNPDVLDELDRIYDISVGNTSQQPLARQILEGCSDIARDYLQRRGRSITECPQFQSPPTTTP